MPGLYRVLFISLIALATIAIAARIPQIWAIVMPRN